MNSKIAMGFARAVSRRPVTLGAPSGPLALGARRSAPVLAANRAWTGSPACGQASTRLLGSVRYQHGDAAVGGEKIGRDLSIKHFRETMQPHPLAVKLYQQEELKGNADVRDRYGRVYTKAPMTINHIWTQQEIDERLSNLWQHKPETRSDQVMHRIMWSLYRGFNWATGFKPINTPVKAVEWRLIVLESFAGVPGFMAAMFRHFRSLRLLRRDYGWIHTLLEEAENERMHLLVCMQMFEAGIITRFGVISAQVFMTPWLAAVYLVNPGAVHRFVGYLEETACITYANIISQVETPGTPLHREWGNLPAPPMAKSYWKLSEDAMWVDVLKCIFADESNHRDVNHTFATMTSDDPNPYVAKHKADAVHAWRLEQEGRNTDVGDYRTLRRKGSLDGPRVGSDVVGAQA